MITVSIKLSTELYTHLCRMQDLGGDKTINDTVVSILEADMENTPEVEEVA